MSNEYSKYELPKGWVWTTIGELGIVTSGGTPSTRERRYWNGDIPWISPADLTGYKEKYIAKGNKSITQEGTDESSAKLLPQGSILFSSRAPIGYVAIAKNVLATNQGFKNLIPVKSLSEDYVYHYLKSAKQLAEGMASGTTFLELSATKFAQIPIPLPPLKEQYLIVTKLEEVFSELENSISAVKIAQQQLKVYRQVLLKQAFEGKLTVQWRKENNTEQAEMLLQRINEERQARYEQELKDWKEAVKKWEKKREKEKRPRKPRVPTKVSSLTSDELALLPKIPKTWLWDKFGAVCLKIMDGTHFSPKNSENGDYMYITAKNIQEGRIDLEGITYVTEEDHRTIYSRCDVQKGDILYIKDGATTGRTAVNDIDEEFSLLSSVGVFRTPKNLLIPKFLEYYLNSEVTRKRMLSKTAGVAITRLTLVKLNNSAVCLCSTDEQEKIVEILESQFSIIDNLEKTISSSLQKSEFLRQSILKKAFKGELINQDINDEPASLLLDRIKKEREAFLKVEKERKSLDKSLNKKRRNMTKELKDIIDILKENKEPILTKSLWEDSIYKDDIEKFYAELKVHIEAGEIIEMPRQGKKSYLKLADEK